MSRFFRFPHLFVVVMVQCTRAAWHVQATAATGSNNNKEETLSDILLAFAASLQTFVNERRFMCPLRTEVRGFYFAQFEPCQLAFFAASSNENRSNSSSNTTSVAVINPDPIKSASSAVCSQPKNQIGMSFPYWSRNASNAAVDGDEDKVLSLPPSKLYLHFWPDSCVGIVPRCFSLMDNERIKYSLQQLQDDGHFPSIPDSATHIRVDCTSDSKKSFDYDFTAEAIPFINEFIDGADGVVSLIFIISVIYAALGCFCCCCCLGSKKQQRGSSSSSSSNRRVPVVPPEVGVNPEDVNAVQLDEAGVNPDDVNDIQLDDVGMIGDRLPEGLRRRPLAPVG